MDKINLIRSVAAPLLMANVDTDIISPMAALTSSSGSDPFAALEKYAFGALRYVNGDVDTAQADPNFFLNDSRYTGAEILITGENFGCGSSRETAPAGIYALGIRCLIGTTFGDIFFNNCYQRGILPIQLNKETILDFVDQCESGEFVVDLDAQTIVAPRGNLVGFEMNQFRKQSLLKGLDDISMTLEQITAIKSFQARDRDSRPWIYT